MTVSVGSRLGPYEILSPLGAGGMGEVFRARDTRLSREVAIKVLPADVSSDPARLKRFEKDFMSADREIQLEGDLVATLGDDLLRAGAIDQSFVWVCPLLPTFP